MTSEMYVLIIGILFMHWVADFVLQTDWQAKNKSSNNIALLKHVGSYSAVLFVASLFLFTKTEIALYWVMLNSLLHFATDYVTSRINSYLWNKGDVHNFFVMVGFDQLIHYVCLFGTLLVLQ